MRPDISIADRVAEFTQDDREHTRVELGDVTVTVTRPTDSDPAPVELALAATANVCDARGATTPADSPGHAGSVIAQIRQAEQNGTLPDGVNLTGGDD